jgi:hypothetical protein
MTTIASICALNSLNVGRTQEPSISPSFSTVLQLLFKAGIKLVGAHGFIINPLSLIHTGSNGANLSFPAAFGIDSGSEGCLNGTISSTQCQSWEWIVGFINACPYIVIAVL